MYGEAPGLMGEADFVRRGEGQGIGVSLICPEDGRDGLPGEAHEPCRDRIHRHRVRSGKDPSKSTGVGRFRAGAGSRAHIIGLTALRPQILA